MAAPAGSHTLSERAKENVEGVDYWKPLVAAAAKSWSPSNPQGMAVLGVAENTLMHDELEDHIKKNFDIHRHEHFSYGHGPQGSLRLRSALSEFFNDHFYPLNPTKPNEFVSTTGVTALIDHITWTICDDGEAILFPRPLYPGFTNDVPTRARGKLIPVSFVRSDGSYDHNDVFDKQANELCLERAINDCLRDGIKVKGVMITNPHNPLGKCYPVETIQAIATFCARHELHYLSDEIYAMSTFHNEAAPQATHFTSVVSIDLDSIINPLRVHVLYGMAKDFCSNGFRLGTLHSRNPALVAAVTGIAAFSWEAYLVQDIWARILDDRPFLDWFLAENRKRLSTRYEEVTSWLREKGIPYFGGGNAGVFIWLDLRSWIRDSADFGNLNALLVTSPESQKYKALEKLLSDTCWDAGVMISGGTSFLTEELGWFRIVFTVEEKALWLGLDRFLESLHEFLGSRSSKRQ